MSKARQHAQRLLHHYLETVFRKAGLGWGGDNDVEVYGIVDQIICAAQHENPVYVLKVRYAVTYMKKNGRAGPSRDIDTFHTVRASSPEAASQAVVEFYKRKGEASGGTCLYYVVDVEVGEPIPSFE